MVFLDASTVAVEASLMQKQGNGRLHPLQYAISSLYKEGRRYSSFEQESVAAIFCLMKFWPYILSGPFVSYTNYQALNASFGKQALTVGLQGH